MHQFDNAWMIVNVEHFVAFEKHVERFQKVEIGRYLKNYDLC